MERSRILLVLVATFYSGNLSPAQDVPVQPDGSAQPSLNQSLSIEEPAPPSEQIEKNNAATTVSSPIGNPVADSAARTPPMRSTTMLGRKRAGTPLDGSENAALETPWYRSSLGALGIVLALMGVIYLGLKRWAPSMRTSDGGLVRVVSRTVVGPRQSVLLLRVGRRMVLVGVSPDRVDRVCEIADPEEVAAIVAQGGAVEARGPFSSWLDREAAQFVAEAGNEPSRARGGEVQESTAPAVGKLLQKLRATKV